MSQPATTAQDPAARVSGSRPSARWLRAVASSLRLLASLMLLAAVGLTATVAVLRYVFGLVPTWSETAVILGMLWSAMAVAGLGLLEGSHVRYGLLARVAPRADEYGLVATGLLSMAFAIALGWSGVQLMTSLTAVGATFASGVPQAVVASPIVLAAASVGLGGLSLAVRTIGDLRHGAVDG